MAIATGTAIAAAAVVGGAATAYSANKASRAAQAGADAQREAASEANALSREQFDWNKWVYENDIAPANRANQELQMLLAEDYLDTSQTNKDFANEQRDEYRRTYLPNERRVVEEAQNYDSASNVARRSGMAAANVNQQFSNASAQRARTLGRYGLNPNSSTFASQSGKDAIAQAAAASGAATGAAIDTQDKAIALRSGVANFGRGFPNTAAQATGLSNASNAGASGASQASANAAAAGVPMMNGAYNSRVGGIMDYGNTMGRAGMQEAGLWSGVAQGLGGLTGSVMQGGLGGWGGMQAKLSGTSFGSSGFGTGLAYGNQDIGAFL